MWNLEPERYAEVPGATVLDSPAAVRAASDIVIFCVLRRGGRGMLLRPAAAWRAHLPAPRC